MRSDRSALHFGAIVLVLSSAAAAEQFPCCLREPTAREIADYNRGATRLSAIMLNHLAVQRMNAARSRRISRGQPPGPGSYLSEADAVPFSFETVGELMSAADTAPAAVKGASVPLLTASGQLLGAGSLPGQVDNSLLAYFPPIGSQIGGSCASFSATYYQMTHMTALARNWDAKSGGNAFRFSTKWTYNLVNGTGSGGSTILAPPALLMAHGAPTLTDWPYDGNLREWCRNGDIWRRALGFRMAARGYIGDLDSEYGLNTLKALLVNGYVLTFATEVYSWQQRTIPDDPSTTDDDAWVGQKICRYRNGSDGPHAMTIVGYNNYIWCDVNENGIVDPGEKGALKIANSWGTGDWNSGFRWICYDALKTVSAVENGPTLNRFSAFTSAYWLAAHAGYTAEMVAVFTVRHPRRRQMSMSLGKSTTSVTEPDELRYSVALSSDGGDYAFDGSTTVCDGTFALDFTDLEPEVGVSTRYYLGMRDQTWGPETGEIKAFELQDASGGLLAAYSGPTVPVADGATEYVYIDFTYNNGPAVTVTVQAPDASAAEAGGDPGQFRIIRTGGTAGDLSVNFTMKGRAALVNDYTLSTGGEAVAGDVVIPDGASEVAIDLLPIDDWYLEGTETAELVIERGCGYGIGASDTAAVKISDDDEVQITTDYHLSAGSTPYIYVPEGGSRNVRVRLTAAPPDDVTVATTRSWGDEDISVSAGAVLVFTPADWNNWQTFTLTAAEDADTFSGGAMTSSTATGMAPCEINLCEVENDKVCVIAEAYCVDVPEGGAAQFRLKCTMAPAEDFSVTAEYESGDPDITISGNDTVAFGPSDWDNWKAVTLAAAEDLDGCDGAAKFYCRPSLSTVDSPGIIARELDNEPPGPGIVTGTNEVQVSECGEAQFTVRLSVNPGSPAAVGVFHYSGDADILVKDGASLLFDSTNWCQPQSVSLEALQDPDALNGSAVIRCEIPGVADAEVTATEWDADRVQILTDPQTLAILEGGDATLQVRLAEQPPGDITLNVTRDGGDADLSVTSGATLFFSTATWDAYQPVTIAAAEDAGTDNGNASFLISGDGAEDAWLWVTEIDNDEVNIVTSVTGVEVPENGTASFSVRLSANPGADVTVTTALTGDTDVTIVSGGTLNFSVADYQSWQPVTLAAADDADAQNGWAQANVESSGLQTARVQVSEADDDIVDIVVDASQVSVPEGATADFGVKLSGPPIGDLEITTSVVFGDPDLGVSSGGTLEFDNTNWNVYQYVTLSAAEDADTANGWAKFRCDAGWGSGANPAEVKAFEADNDVLQILTDVDALDVPEGGTATFNVKLSTDPGSPLIVSAAFYSGDTDITVTGGASLNFDSTNWMDYQPVELSAAEDDDVAGGSAVILCSAAGVADKSVTASEVDNDTLEIVTNVASVGVPEGGSAGFQVRLSHQPSGTVSVSVAWNAGDPDITVTAGSSLSFDAGDWMNYKTVDLSAAEDPDTTSNSAVIECSSPGLSTQSVTAHEIDNDSPDTTPPALTLTSIVVNGTVADDTAVASVTVDGTSISFSGGTFTGEAPLSSLPAYFAVTASDTSSNTTTIDISITP